MPYRRRAAIGGRRLVGRQWHFVGGGLAKVDHGRSRSEAEWDAVWRWHNAQSTHRAAVVAGFS